MWSDEASDAVDTAFDTFGIGDDPGDPVVTYTPPDGASLPCVVIMKAADRIVAFGDGRPFAEGTVIEVRADDIAEPVDGGVFAIGNSSFTILGDPEQLDDMRLVWTCRVR